ncbi:MAG: sigma 54-interacting transcriptional regulator [Myxococcales bacterium]|nr:sigma 54-interacting transcriptional regulator [Myxococcales bacterium]
MLPHADIAESHAHFRLGNIERAEDLFDRAAAAWLEKQNLARVAESAIRFGNLLAEAGDLGRAIRVLQKGLDAAIRGSYGELVRRFVARITELDREALVLQPIRSNPDFALSDAETAAPARAEEIVGISPAIETVRELVRRVAPTDVPVLVTGESGVGKELVARAIHGSSPRHARPLVVVNCGAIPEGLVEAELFGHRKGAFTGAVRDAPGKLVLADGGTVFLDEVGDLPLSAQVKILRFLQSGEVHTVGDAAASARRVNVRVIAATNRDLARMAADGRFRSDLLFRLNTFPIRVPPLRERPEDIRPIAEHLMRTDPVFRSRGIVKVSRAAMDALRRHTWPGNVRELHGALVYAAVLARGDTLQSHVLPESVTGCVEPASPATFPTLQEVQREHVARALELAGGNQSRAAELLGVHRNTLRNWMLFGRDRPEPRRPESRSASPPKGRSPSPTRSKP